MTKEIQNTGVAPGLQFERTEAEGLFFFQYNDATGMPVLFSQPYHSADKRDQGIETLRKNATDAGHYAEIEADGRFFFVIKAGNHKEIARSQPYKTAAECKKATKAFQAQWKIQTDERDATKLDQEVERQMDNADTTHLRYRFALNFYVNKTNNRILGKIEYPLAKDDKESFEGLDLERIGSFISQRLPKPKALTAQTKLPETIEMGFPQKRELDILENGHKISGASIRRGAAFELHLHLSPEEIGNLEGKGYKASLRIKQMEQGAKTLFMEEQGVMHTNGTIGMKAPAQNLEAGLYRFTLHATVENPANREEIAEWEGSSLLVLN